MHLDKEATKQVIYVIKGLNLALARLPTIKALNLVTKIFTIDLS